jgi:tRNA(Ile)-lysidine synthase
MNLKFIRDIPLGKIFVACSGGADSLALLHYARSQGLDPEIAYFGHGDDVQKDEHHFFMNHIIEHNFKFTMMSNHEVKPNCKSPKEFYREKRYAFLSSLNGTVLLGHTLDDVAEGFLFYTIRCGEGHLIPYQRDNCIRPFLLNTKQDCIDFLQKIGVQWFEDPTNEDRKFTRNLIRHDMMPLVNQVNPGFKKVVRRKLIEKLKREEIL